MLNQLWLGGDDEIKTDDAYFNAAKSVLMGLLKYPDAEVTTLENRKTQNHLCI